MALRDTRVVAISGPRQSGKTTLARRLARQGRTYLTLDSQPTLAAARSDPVAFIRGLDRVIIDEVQRAPDLLLAIKESVDEDPRPGRFLLTGSANLLTVKSMHESLAGRIEIVSLYPLGRSERLRSKTPQFINNIFRGQVPRPAEPLIGDKLLRLVAAGGYPDAIKRRADRRRQDWYLTYIKSIVERDIPEIADVAMPDRIPKLLEICARFAGQLTNLSEMGRAIGLDHKTVEHYLRVLEQIYLVQRVQPWSRNELSRLVKTPKLHFIDSGLLTSMRGYSLARLRSDRSLFGPLLESFVFSELLKATAWAGQRVSLFHYRDKDLLEVDFVLENSAGEIVGIEVKAAASVVRRDFAGLERVAAAAGTAFVQGILLYDGEKSLSFANNLAAAPLPTLWG
ncbi:MAG: ATP-binding protein [Acidobacteria bacterium]|nr:ATP-binding protein [Acidobacteriota bacterium]